MEACTCVRGCGCGYGCGCGSGCGCVRGAWGPCGDDERSTRGVLEVPTHARTHTHTCQSTERCEETNARAHVNNTMRIRVGLSAVTDVAAPSSSPPHQPTGSPRSLSPLPSSVMAREGASGLRVRHPTSHDPRRLSHRSRCQRHRRFHETTHDPREAAPPIEESGDLPQRSGAPMEPSPVEDARARRAMEPARSRGVSRVVPASVSLGIRQATLCC